MIKRSLLDPLKKHLKSKEISLIVGPRQAGKTTLMRLLETEIRQKGGKTLFFNLDIDTDRPLFTTQQALVRKIELEIGKNPGVVFIDEIQRKQDAGLFLKGLFDMELPYKFVVSGSGSLELKEKIHESLVGRKRIFELSTLTFDEFLHFKTDYRYESNLPEFLQLEKDQANSILQEYLNFGGYPRVVLAQTREEKEESIREIFQSYLERDVEGLLRVEKTEKFALLVRLLASQIGELLNVSEISNSLGIAQQTTKIYLLYLEKTFILKRLTPFFQNGRKELTKNRVPYFSDLGLRNYAAREFGTATTKQTGFLLQNFVAISILEKQRIEDLHYWRTTDKAEVDFVTTSRSTPLPIEVKNSQLKTPEIPRSLKSFLTKYSPKLALLVNQNLKNEVEINKTRINFVPAVELSNVLRELWQAK